jgi:hypothetical protein
LDEAIRISPQSRHPADNEVSRTLRLASNRGVITACTANRRCLSALLISLDQNWQLRDDVEQVALEYSAGKHFFVSTMQMNGKH